MTTSTIAHVNPHQLVKAWEETLPNTLNETDSVEVVMDGVDPNALRIHIDTAGRSDYSFDFVCTYVDDREVKVELVDVEKDGRHVDERTEIIQTMIEDYVRHIHECAQALADLTHSNGGASS